MPIPPFLEGVRFNPEAERIMGVAFEMTCAALKYTKQPDVAHEAVSRESSNSQKTALTTQIGSASGCSKIYASCRRAYSAASVGGPDHQTSHRYSVVQPCHSAPSSICKSDA
jgi:hypothetical protein